MQMFSQNHAELMSWNSCRILRYRLEGNLNSLAFSGILFSYFPVFSNDSEVIVKTR